MAMSGYLKTAFTIFIVGVTILTIWHFWDSATGPRNKEPSPSINASHQNLSAPSDSPPSLSQTYPQISLKNQTKEGAVKVWLQRVQDDKKADWKVPIEFYGRVLDENSKPVPSANINFRWTNLSAKGTSTAQAVADENGLFSLAGVQGKRLSVSVTKKGYYASRAQSDRSFEFSNPGEEIYYEPDSTNPTVFRLRKKGNGAELVKKSIKVLLPGDGSPVNVDVNTGEVAPSGELQIQAWKPWPPRPLSPHYDWKVLFTISDGGFIEAPTEFAFEAPEAVYSQPFDVNMPASARDAWRVSAEKTLYFAFGQPRKYGRLHFRTDGASRYVFIDYVLNPSGSRNLEDASPDRPSQ